MSGVQVCRFERRNAGCAEDFGMGLASRWLDMTPEQVETQAGRFARGKHKGKLRGWVVWAKCVEGGWHYDRRCVIRPGTVYALFCKTYEEMCHWANETTANFLAAAQRVDAQYKAHVQQEQAKQAEQDKLQAEQDKLQAEKDAVVHTTRMLAYRLGRPFTRTGEQGRIVRVSLGRLKAKGYRDLGNGYFKRRGRWCFMVAFGA